MRIDKLMWFLRFAPSRSVAHDWIEAGHFRLNGRRVERAASAVKPGDVVVIPLRTRVAAIEIVTLPTRRGPAAEAAACYRALDAAGEIPIAPGQSTTAVEGDLQP